jgi:ankyrin repeat protein/Mg2+ and Co2+ transporter CorA
MSPSDTTTLYKRLAQVVKSGNLVTLSTVIETQSETREREDVLADALVICCMNGCFDVADYLLTQERADANLPSQIKQSKGYPPLILAVRYFQRKSDSSALKDGQRAKSHSSTANRKNRDGSHNTSERTRLIRSLLDHGALLTTCDPDKQNVLFHIKSGGIAKLLLASRTGPELQEAFTQKDRHGHDALMSAIVRRHESAVSLAFMEHGADIRTVDRHHRTTLMNVSWARQVDLVKKILEDKSIARMKDKGGRTIWHYVAQHNEIGWDEKLISLLLTIDEKDASVNGTDARDRTPLHMCSISGNPTIAKALLESKRAAVDAVEPNEGKTALHFAVACGKRDMVRLLVDHDANRNASCSGGLIPLHLACGCVSDDVDTVMILLAGKPAMQLNALTAETMTPLHIAAAHGHISIVEALLRASAPTAKIDAQCQGRRTALHLACGGQNTDSSSVTRKVADQDARDRVDLVRLLLAEGARVDVKSDDNCTALSFAVKSGNVEIVRLLLTEKDVQFDDALWDAVDSSQNVNIQELLAPWTPRRIEALPREVKQSARSFEAHIIDFHGDPNTRPSQRKIKVFDLLYEPPEKESTRPDKGFRWIHLPANNLHWCHTLLTKYFYEGGCADIDGFKALERSLSQQQCRGRFMRPTCEAHTREPGARDHGHTNASRGACDDHLDYLAHDNNLEALELEIEPQDPKRYRSSADHLAQRMKALAIIMGRGDHSGADLITKPPRNADSTTSDPFKSVLFMPFLVLEPQKSVHSMRHQLSPKTPPKTADTTGTPAIPDNPENKNPDESEKRDVLLHDAYGAWKANHYGLHMRRTLDQFWYRNVDTSQRDDDQVVLRYQQKQNRLAGKEENDKLELLMVDQLWLWVLGPELIVTSFPQDWQNSGIPDHLSSLLKPLGPLGRAPDHSVHGLAARIVNQCMSSCDDAALARGTDKIFEMFGSSVEVAMDEEGELFRRFKEASASANFAKASRWVKKTHRAAETESGDNTDESGFVQDLLDINDEIKLLEEVKDIQDELGILLQITGDQIGVYSKIEHTFRLALEADSWIQQDNCRDQIILLRRQEADFQNMKEQGHRVQKSVTDLLDHKQKHATATEAHYAREQASETAKAGRTLMVFTIVTIIFLPMSFLAAFFAINIKELPHVENEQQLSLSFVMRNVVGVGLGTALAFVIIAWHYHRALKHMRTLKTTATSMFARGRRQGVPRGIKNTKSTIGFMTDSDIEHHVRKSRARDDEEKATKGPL